MKADDAKCLREFERENASLKRIVAAKETGEPGPEASGVFYRYVDLPREPTCLGVNEEDRRP